MCALLAESLEHSWVIQEGVRGLCCANDPAKRHTTVRCIVVVNAAGLQQWCSAASCSCLHALLASHHVYIQCRFCKPLLQPMVHPDRVPVHPVRAILELVQRSGLQAAFRRDECKDAGCFCHVDCRQWQSYWLVSPADLAHYCFQRAPGASMHISC